MEHHAEEEFAGCCLTLVKGRNWEELQIGQLMDVRIPQWNYGVEAKALFLQNAALYVQDKELFAVPEVQYVESESSYLEANELHAEAVAQYVLAAMLFVVVEALYMEAVPPRVAAEALLVEEQEVHHLPVDRDKYVQYNQFLKCSGT